MSALQPDDAPVWREDERVVRTLALNPQKDLADCLDLVAKIVENIAASPEEHKYRSLRAASKALSTRILARPGGREPRPPSSLSAIVLILKETPPYNRNRPLNKAMNQMEVVFNIIFTTEIMLRLHRGHDLAGRGSVHRLRHPEPCPTAGLCFKYKLVVNKRGLRFDRGSGNTKMVKKVKEMFKALRMSLLKLTRRYDGSIVIVHALRDSSSALAAPFFFLFVAVVMCGTFLFVIEDGKPTERDAEKKSQHFGSVVHTIWFMVVTFLTVGFGDVYPMTDKVIFVEKLKEHFQAFSIKRADIEDSFRALDMDGSGSLDYDEFQTALVKMEIKLSSHRMFALWNAIDYDQKGEIRLEEFVNLVFKDQGGAERLLLDDIEDEEEGESPSPSPSRRSLGAR
ncbi:voltage-gated potassium channel [Aureococcus anophagefferens]|nr:voltage-gated potassium channel [Aureococcus anophagefferens]